MGSKGLKYVSIDAGQAARPKARKQEGIWERSARSTRGIISTAPAKEPFPKWGTSVGCVEADALYTFPYKNRVEGALSRRPYARRE